MSKLKSLYAPILAANHFAVTYNLVLSTIMLMKSVFFASLLVSPVLVFATMIMVTIGICMYSLNRAWAIEMKAQEQSALVKSLETKLKYKIKILKYKRPGFSDRYHHCDNLSKEVNEKKEHGDIIKYIKTGGGSAINFLGLTWAVAKWLSCLPIVIPPVAVIAPFTWPVILLVSIFIGVGVGLAKKEKSSRQIRASKRYSAVVGGLKTFSIIEKDMQRDYLFNPSLKKRHVSELQNIVHCPVFKHHRLSVSQRVQKIHAQAERVGYQAGGLFEHVNMSLRNFNIVSQKNITRV